MLPENRAALLLAPMQDITDLPFLRVIKAMGGADLYVTEYFRVHIHSKLDPYILRSITENPTGRPIIAQLIGKDPHELSRTVRDLKNYPTAGIDLNLGCPAPVVYRKQAGGGLLRDPDQINRLIGTLRETCGELPLTIKTRIGFSHPDEFARLLEIFKNHAINLLTVHGRTVKERYQTPVHPETIREAVHFLPCPVIANGNVVNVTSGLTYLEQTQAAGLMIGRGAIRHPWIFSQLRAALSKKPITVVTGKMILEYIQILYDETAREVPKFNELKHVQKMKKYLNYIVQGHPKEFEYEIRRAQQPEEFFRICRSFLDYSGPAPDLPCENSRLFCGFSQFL